MDGSVSSGREWDGLETRKSIREASSSCGARGMYDESVGRGDANDRRGLMALGGLAVGEPALQKKRDVGGRRRGQFDERREGRVG